MTSLRTVYVQQISGPCAVLNPGLCRFLELNTDALLHIFDYLQQDGALFSFSITCWAMREAAMPVLFNSCRILVKEPIDEDHFIPRSLWPYIRTLSLIDKCPDLVAMKRSFWSRELSFTNDRLLCGTMCATFLKDALRAMPLLHSVSLKICAREIHGIGWDSIAAILSTPQLRSFTIGTFLLNPREAPPKTWVDNLAPLTTFRYDQPSYHSYLLTYPTQQDTLASILTWLHRSLESLLLPSEITPVAVLSQIQWPQLRELSLSGEFHQDTGYTAPFVSLFSGMSKLRVLNLTLALPMGVDRKELMLWPEGYESRLPWPDLEALTVSFPDPGDHIYGQLPPSLRHLSLRCTPHACLHRWLPNKYPYHSPILRASEMLDILTKISTPLLDSLQLEYCADDADDHLLRCISDKFSNVRCLEIHRLIASDDEEVSVANVAQRLAALSSLHTLRAHLQLPEAMLQLPPDMSEEEYREARFRARTNFAGLRQTAAILRSEFPQPDLGLWLLQRESLGARWRLFRPVIQQDTDVEQQLQEEFDPAGGQVRLRVFLPGL
ncbi:hypothetical protein V8D89_002253 [Ganoderma adspersum]